ncbi:MAG TPA: MogA/MoaB family molybdenum cofactor biosynthesis protein [Candidatus Polarisedimenticolia bacterium]|nr:MogA/MoaB family molybdenum cofactor biosynthesis protein [Candidatus Polarisedimenticolia bacterium]
MGHREHHREAPRRVRVAVLTVSDTRTKDTDRSGVHIRRLLVKSGHAVEDYRVVRDDPVRIREVLKAWIKKPAIQAVILTGGTGISPRDGTVEVVEALLTKRLAGFGEIFRAISYRRIGASAFLSRATAGLSGSKVLFSLPGSEDAVALAMERLILPELGHLIQQVSKKS